MPTGRGVGSCSQQIQRIFAVQDLLETLAHEDELLDRRLVLVPEHQLTHMLKAEHRHWSVKETVLKQEQGLEFGGEVDRLVGTVLAGCDGHHALCDLVANVCTGRGRRVRHSGSDERTCHSTVDADGLPEYGRVTVARWSPYCSSILLFSSSGSHSHTTS